MKLWGLSAGVSAAVVVAALCVVGGARVRAAGADPVTPKWSAVRAAAYLDQREVWWQQWPHAQKDHGTVCLSCHTGVPYAMVRPGLDGVAGVKPEETRMLGDVEKRVNGWAEMETFYTDAKNGPGKTAQSRATEAMMNAVVLLSVDRQEGKLRAVTRKAVDEAWALQLTDGPDAGGWIWQDFHLSPWESTESGYQGTALLELALREAPGGYAAEPGVREHVAAMEVYLRRRYREQPLLNQLYVLWASGHAKGLLPAEERAKLIARLQSIEQKDGGWSTYSLDHIERIDESAPVTVSDGYATALVVLALKSAGVASGNGLRWLRENQLADGRWPASSLNKVRDEKNVAALFMSDAATAYAVMALEGKQ